MGWRLATRDELGDIIALALDALNENAATGTRWYVLQVESTDAGRNMGILDRFSLWHVTDANARGHGWLKEGV